jgi:uncharacterized YccA/Bax inhibitor family protein
MVSYVRSSRRMRQYKIITQSVSYRSIKALFGYLLTSRAFAIGNSCVGAISRKSRLILSGSEVYGLLLACIKSSAGNAGYLISSTVLMTVGIYLLMRYLAYHEVGPISIITVSLLLLVIHPAGVKIMKYANTVFKNSIVFKVLNTTLLK